MLYLFSKVDQLPDEFPATCSSFLPERRRIQMMSYRRISDRKLCASAYLLLVYALKYERLFNALPEFGYGANGKPFLFNYSNVHFNLSHCQGAVACILSDKEVGIDIEQVSEYDDELAQTICNEQEYLWVIENSDLFIRAQRFTKLWTIKESILKWRGSGIDGDVKKILNGKIPANNFTCNENRVETHFDIENKLCIAVCTNNTNKNINPNLEYENKILSIIEQPVGHLL
jgi:4'-phosphopantetheinyl transferase